MLIAPRSGVGQRTPPPLEPGDVVTLKVEGPGLVRSKVAEPGPVPPIPPARRGQPCAPGTEALGPRR